MTRIKNIARALTSLMLALLVALSAPGTALAAVNIERFDPQTFYDGVSYVTRNPNAPSPSLPWVSGQSDVMEMVGCHLLDDGTFESNATSHDNGAAGMRVTVRFPSQGIYHDAVTGEEFVVGIYDTFEVIQSIGTTDDHVRWYPGGSKTGQLLLDGWWVVYTPFYKDTYVFKRAGTNQVVTVHNIGYTERSMNSGEGFALEGASRGFVTDDMPDWSATTSDGDYFKSNHIPGTNVLTADINSRGAHGFVGALSTTVGPNHTVTNQLSSFTP